MQYFDFGQQSIPNFDKFQPTKITKREIALKILQKIKDMNIIKYFNQIDKFYSSFLELIKSVNTRDDFSSTNVFSKTLKIPEGLILPSKKNLFPKLRISQHEKKLINLEYDPFSSNPMEITALEKSYSVLSSKEKPLKISFRCNDSSVRLFLIKREPKGDVRKESRTMDFINFAIFLLQSASSTSKRNFEIETFSIIPLTSRYSLIEWCEKTSTIRSILDSAYSEKKLMINIRQILQKFPPENSRADVFSPNAWTFVSKMPALLDEYFFKQFKGVHLWYEAFLNYNKSLAFWSALGYIIGLGDRHADNILLNIENGNLICIDFDCIFQKGKDLAVPEIVEFRLTKNIESALGVFKSWGLYKLYFVMILKVFKKHIDEILGTLDTFISDPLIEYNTPDSKTQKGIWRFNPEQIFRSIKERVEFVKYSSIDVGVDFLIENSKNPECLKEMFIGWCPHL